MTGKAMWCSYGRQAIARATSSGTSALRSTWAQLSYLPRALGLVRAAAPGWTLTWACLLAIQGVLPAGMVYVTRQLVDSLVTAIGSSGAWDQVGSAVMYAALLAGIILATEVLQSAVEWVRTAQSEFVRDHMSKLIHEKSTTVDLAFYESPEYFDRLQRAREDANVRPLALLEHTGSLLQTSITLLAIGAILVPYGLWLPLALVASTLPALIVALRFNWRHHRWWERTTADRRRNLYYDALLTHHDYAAELRLFDFGPHFRSAFQALRRRLRNERLQLVSQQSLAQIGSGIFVVLVSGLAIAWIGWRALQGLATLGDLALFYQAFSRGQTLMRTLLSNVGQIYSNSLFLGNLFEFLALEPRVVAPAEPVPVPAALEKGICFRDVTFRYPGSERDALRNFNLTVAAGQIVAIVGANGAGKSTLIRLLCRFYDLTSGRIELDGLDIRELSLTELRGRISVLFQAPAPYQLTAAENVALGDLAAAPARVDIEAAARGAGAHGIIERLPRRYDTLLGKWFAGGTELSGGEWQRVALARTFLKKAQIVILDEPTSFMDTWAEVDWLAHLRTFVRGQTVIIITHRFTTAMQADVIHVMDRGQIVESGSHADLMSADRRYAQSWRAQLRSADRQRLAARPPGQEGGNGDRRNDDPQHPRAAEWIHG